MAGSFFGFMFGGKTGDKAVQDQMPENNETQVMDEQIGEWSHKFVVYCKNPPADFEKTLKDNSCVVAVFGKAKESKTPKGE